LLRRCGDGDSEAVCTIALGQLAIDTGAPDDAAGPLAEPLRFAYEAGLRPVVPGCLEALAPVAVMDARRRACSAPPRPFARSSTPFPSAPTARRERTLAAASEALDAEVFAVARGRGRAMGWREAVELALSVGSGDLEEAATRAAPRADSAVADAAPIKTGTRRLVPTVPVRGSGPQTRKTREVGTLCACRAAFSGLA